MQGQQEKYQEGLPQKLDYVAWAMANFNAPKNDQVLVSVYMNQALAHTSIGIGSALL